MLKQLFVVVSVLCATAGAADAQQNLQERRDAYAQKCDAYGLEAMKLQENFTQYKIWSIVLATYKQTICREGLQIIDEVLKQQQASSVVVAATPLVAAAPTPSIIERAKPEIVSVSLEEMEGPVPLPRRDPRKVRRLHPHPQIRAVMPAYISESR